MSRRAHTIKALFIREIEYKKDAHGTAIVCGRDRAETLLARCVPLRCQASCVFVRTIWSLTRFPSTSIVRILKSIPIVVMKDGVHASSQNRSRRQDLPTPRGLACMCGSYLPESPIKSSLTSRS